jgi:hypothetical protein
MSSRRRPLRHRRPSYPAQAGYQVRRGFSVLSLTSWNTGSPAFAGDDSERVVQLHFHSQTCFRDLAAHSARVLLLTSHPLKSEGAGKAGCALHPRSRVQMHTAKTHTSIQVQRRTSGLPCAMVLRLTSCSCVRKICQNVRTGGSDQPPVAGSEPDRAQRPLRACRGARDRSGVFLNPNSCMGFEPEPSKEGSG